jgi:hypothetical protein
LKAGGSEVAKGPSGDAAAGLDEIISRLRAVGSESDPHLVFALYGPRENDKSEIGRSNKG